MQYDDRVPFTGDRAAAVERAAQTLMALNFRVTRHEPEWLEAVGPGYRSTKQNPILGATFIRLSFLDDTGEARLEADLGGARWMHRFVHFFPLGLGLFLYVLLSVVLGGRFTGPVTLSVFGPLIIWLFIAPLLARRIIAGTVRALETFFFNVTGYHEDEDAWRGEGENSHDQPGTA